ncbi:MAG: hypothetical protein Q8R48_02470, partial [Candidatus Omnitrophota bacterium]|nr:hypothetical protein [Candidatus Omnitrophota bacterium]
GALYDTTEAVIDVSEAGDDPHAFIVTQDVTAVRVWAEDKFGTKISGEKTIDVADKYERPSPQDAIGSVSVDSDYNLILSDVKLEPGERIEAETWVDGHRDTSAVTYLLPEGVTNQWLDKSVWINPASGLPVAHNRIAYRIREGNIPEYKWSSADGDEISTVNTPVPPKASTIGTVAVSGVSAIKLDFNLTQPFTEADGSEVIFRLVHIASGNLIEDGKLNANARTIGVGKLASATAGYVIASEKPTTGAVGIVATYGRKDGGKVESIVYLTSGDKIKTISTSNGLAGFGALNPIESTEVMDLIGGADIVTGGDTLVLGNMPNIPGFADVVAQVQVSNYVKDATHIDDPFVTVKGDFKHHVASYELSTNIQELFKNHKGKVSIRIRIESADGVPLSQYSTVFVPGNNNNPPDA